MHRAARLMIWISHFSSSRPHTDAARRRSVGKVVGFFLEGYFIRCGYGPSVPKHCQGKYFEVNQSLDWAFGGLVDFPSLPWHSPKM